MTSRTKCRVKTTVKSKDGTSTMIEVKASAFKLASKTLFQFTK